MTPIADAARAVFPALELDDEQAADVRVGRRLDLTLEGPTALFAPDGEFLALYRRVRTAARRPWQCSADDLSVLWLRRDLRRRDLPALGAAADAAGDGDVHVLFVIDPVLWDRCGPVRRGWLAASVRAAAESYDGRLTVRVGDPATKVGAFAAEVGAGSVHVSAETTPYGAARDDRVRRAARGARDRGGSPPARRTPWGRGGCGPSRAGRTASSRPSPAPGASTAGPTRRPRHAAYASGTDAQRRARRGTRLERALAECPVDLPTAGEDAALRRWRAFRDERLGDYADGRDRPDLRGHVASSRRTSRSARSTRARSWPTSPATGPRRPRSSPTSWPGASSTPTCCTTTRASAWRDLRPELALDDLRRPARAAATRGRRGAPASRSSTPGCASSPRPAGCTTGSG